LGAPTEARLALPRAFGAAQVVRSLRLPLAVLQVGSVYRVTLVVQGIVVEPQLHDEHERVSLNAVKMTERLV
jgi:hypothetical protein